MSETIGDQLSKARQDQGLTLVQISQALHIREGYLKALEADNWEDMPSEVQGRGFLRLYAGHLNLPVQPLLDERQAQLNALNPDPEPAPKPIKPPRQLRPKKSASSAQSALPAESVPDKDWRRILIEIGQVLQERRQTLGLKLDDVEQHTHIPPTLRPGAGDRSI
jgi:cytoskeleton protein RodZ